MSFLSFVVIWVLPVWVVCGCPGPRRCVWSARRLAWGWVRFGLLRGAVWSSRSRVWVEDGFWCY
jgi:hypothetical protein